MIASFTASNQIGEAMKKENALRERKKKEKEEFKKRDFRNPSQEQEGEDDTAE